MRLETPRLILRKPEIADIGDYLEVVNSEFVRRYNAMTIVTPEKAVAEFVSAKEDHSLLVMESKSNNKVIGVICTHEDSIRYGVDSRELSYFLREEESGKGYMKEALRGLIRHLFEQEHLTCIAARCFAPNVASQRLLESLGFLREGVVRRCVKGYQDTVFDDCLYSLMQEDWAAACNME